MLTETAAAKLNLALHVRRRRADGQHEIETIFAFTAFGDSLQGEAADALTLAVTGEFGAAAGEGGDNLVLRAARALAAAAGARAGAALRLNKCIPVAAGLGGGSADAAAALRLLNRLWCLDWNEARLVEIAAGIGADVAACVGSRTVFGRGRGETLTPLANDWSGTPVLLVNPRVAVQTGPVFAGWNGVDRGALDPTVPLARTRNDLAPPALAIAPAIGDVLDWLARQPGVVLTRMSGSGATCFALFDVDESLARAAADVPSGWWSTATRLI